MTDDSTQQHPRILDRPVWTDRPGESWTNTAAAARATGVRSRTMIREAIETGRRIADRLWFDAPPPWAVTVLRERAAEAARRELHRAASVRCHPGRYGRVYNGIDVTTGVVYAGGRPVAGAAVDAA